MRRLAKEQSGKELDTGSWNQGQDAVARQINKLLAERVQALLSYDKDQGPLVRWVEKPGKPEPKQRQVANQQSSQPQKAGKPREKVVGGPSSRKKSN